MLVLSIASRDHRWFDVRRLGMRYFSLGTRVCNYCTAQYIVSNSLLILWIALARLSSMKNFPCFLLFICSFSWKLSLCISHKLYAIISCAYRPWHWWISFKIGNHSKIHLVFIN
ncbi:Hypothetical predicted protein [Olea europaea subsp. europaea]|uniref:Uncharacterized protein n=1 Tax=Olea europaea subsp. europaea TaxID=158383 RepID=A0A8S0TZI7_OLEEU|nr:Hypothetical predicted protein [Olea europaea subsp. europaea]